MPDKIDSADNWRPRASCELLLKRALMLKTIRAFFDAENVIEVETPLLSQYASTDPHLDSLQSHFRGQRCFLNTSPEYAMKRILAVWRHPIYQICKAFRDDELGNTHQPEFTMLEWYRPGFDMTQLMNELAGLIQSLCAAASFDSPRFEYMSYQQAFEDATGINPHKTTSSACYRFASDRQVEIPLGLGADDDVDEWLDWLLIQQVLPAFKKDGFTFLYDYPASQCALAKIACNEQQLKVAKRFELFFGELELANGFYELTDAKEQAQRFAKENVVRSQKGKPDCNIDRNFVAALKHGLPECSGVAVGLDRLLMVLTNTNRIEQVMSFSWGNN